LNVENIKDIEIIINAYSGKPKGRIL